MDDLKRDHPKHPDQTVSFSVGVAPSSNHMHIGRTKKLNKIAIAYIQDTQRKCSEALQKIGWQKDRESVWYYMDLYFFMPDKRIRDSHNCIKLLMDSLQGILFHNDYYVMPRIQLVELCKDNPRIEITFHSQEVK